MTCIHDDGCCSTCCDSASPRRAFRRPRRTLCDFCRRLYTGPMDGIDRALAMILHGDVEASDRLLRTLPRDARVQHLLGWHNMRTGGYAAGSRQRDAGRAVGAYGSPPPPFAGKYPLWSPDQRTDGRRILIHLEGALGDQIHHARFAKDLHARGASVAMTCAPALRGVLGRDGFPLFDPNDVYGVDAWLPSMSAGWALGHTWATHPGAPYLRAAARPRDGWSRWLADKKKLPVIGVRWAGSPRYPYELSLRRYDPAPLAQLAGEATLVSLQRDDGVAMTPPAFLNVADALYDMEQLAGLVAKCDLVVTSDTMVAHLAGAMGVPVWILVSSIPSDYFMYPWGGTTTPSYGSARIFRQTRPGEWKDVLEKVIVDVRTLLCQGSGRTSLS